MTGKNGSEVFSFADGTTISAIMTAVNAETATLMLDLRLYDTAATLVAAFDGLSVRQLPPDVLRPVAADTVTDWLYHVRWDELPLSEVARVVGCSTATAKSRLRYGLAKLRRRLKREGSP